MFQEFVNQADNFEVPCGLDGEFVLPPLPVDEPSFSAPVPAPVPPAKEICLIANAYKYLGNVPTPFNSPDYEWETNCGNLANAMLSRVPLMGTLFDGFPIELVIKTVAGRAVLSAAIQTRTLRLDFPEFVDNAHTALEAHNAHSRQLHSRMMKLKGVEEKAEAKAAKEIERGMAKIDRERAKVLEKQEKARQKEMAKAVRELNKRMKETERLRVKEEKVNDIMRAKEERMRLKKVAQNEKRVAAHLKKRQPKAPSQQAGSDDDADDTDSDDDTDVDLHIDLPRSVLTRS